MVVGGGRGTVALKEAVKGELGKEGSFQSFRQENLASHREAPAGESETRVQSWPCT